MKETTDGKLNAVYREYYGGPEVFSIKELSMPFMGENDVLVRVHATTVNRTDCAILRAKPFIMRFFIGLFKPKQKIPGTDFSGVIEQVGESVSTFQVGDRVMGFNDQGTCSQAEYMSFSARKNLFKMPDGLTFRSAAASMEGAHYALNIINKITIVPGQKVLINGATGAIGSALVQFCKAEGMNVTAVCKEEHQTLVTNLGAHKVLNYLENDFTQLNEKFDYVFDAVGKSTFGKCKRILIPKGIYISSELGPWSQNIFFSLIGLFKKGQKVIFPIPTHIDRSYEYVRGLIEKGQFKPLIDRAYPMTEAADAYRYVMSGEKVGNVILDLKENSTPI
jgi:NADPH:quinone reductase-like Zn-dependent oxidoreductase